MSHREFSSPPLFLLTNHDYGTVCCICCAWLTIIVETLYHNTLFNKIQLSQNQNGGYRFAIILPTNTHLLNVFNFDELSVLSPAGELGVMHTVL
jgi:hypothetical protein